MELSWSTFLLEVLNFLVLVWILKHFLYRPVLDVISKRKQGIAQTLQAAKDEREGGEQLRIQYQQQLSAWERERTAVRSALHDEIRKERAERLALLTSELNEERRKQQVLTAREREKNEHRLETQALALAGRFTSKLLTRIAGPELESRLIEMIHEDLPRHSSDRHEALRKALQSADATVEVTSAFPIDEAAQAKLRQTLTKLTGENVACHYRQDSRLIAGLRLHVGAWVLRANLLDELKGFTEAGGE